MDDKMMSGKHGGMHGSLCGGGGCGCKCMHHTMLPVLVVAFGLTFLFGNMGVIDQETVNFVWPLIVILAGLKKIFAGMCKCC